MYKKTFKLSFSKWAAAATTTTPDVCICLIGGKNESLIFCSQDISIERRQIYSRTKCIQKQNYSLKKNRHYWNCIYQLQIAMRNNIYFLFLLCIKATALITYAYIIYIYILAERRAAQTVRVIFLFFYNAISDTIGDQELPRVRRQIRLPPQTKNKKQKSHVFEQTNYYTIKYCSIMLNKYNNRTSSNIPA